MQVFERKSDYINPIWHIQRLAKPYSSVSIKFFFFVHVVANKTWMQWYFLYWTILCGMWLWNEGLIHDGQQFHQYQQTTSHLKITEYNKDQDILRWKFRYCLCVGTHITLWISVALLTITVYTKHRNANTKLKNTV